MKKSNVIKAFFAHRKEREFQKSRKGYYSINTDITAFISPPIIGSFLFIASVISFGHKHIWHYFIAGEVPLNSMIVTTILFALGLILYNLLNMRSSAKVIRVMEEIGERNEIEGEDTLKLHMILSKKGKLINTKQMTNVIEKMFAYSTLFFSDEEARLIKSKIGQRCSHNRAAAGFLAGLLIMMGLLGTYLGLLETIDKVGAAMGSMANIGGSSSGAASGSSMSDDQMSGFIGSIAAPLQGMGLAFSASLFGIGGSLIVSYFNYLAGHVQNHFIENVSRWIDERIMKPEVAAQKMAESGKMPHAGDLKSWLTAFAILSNKTHQKLGRLIIVLSHTLKMLIKQKDVVAVIGSQQENMGSDLAAIRQHMQDIKKQYVDTSSKSEQHIREIQNNLANIAKDNASYKNTGAVLATHAQNVAEKISSLNDNIRSSSESLVREMQSVRMTVGATETASQSLVSAVSELKQGIENMAKIESRLASVQSDRPSGPAGSTETDLSNLIWQINSLVEEMTKGNQDTLAELLAEASNGGGEGEPNQ